MDVRIYFDAITMANRIADDYVGNLSIHAPLFDGRFLLGATACQQIDISIENTAFSSIPSVVYITDDNDTKLYTMLLDSYEIEDDYFTHFTLMDAMVRFNQPYDWRTLEYQEAQYIVGGICSLVTEYTCVGPTYDPNGTVFNFGGDYEITWDYAIPARDVIASIAEINGCFARIDANGNLEFVPAVIPTFDANHVIGPDTVSGIIVGDVHTFDGVVYDNGVVVAQSATCGSHPYIMNPDNIVFTEGREQDIVENIYNRINGYTFYNVEVEQCEINDNVRVGDMLSLTIFGETYNFIAEIEWEYNTGWSGGYTLELENDLERTTEVISETDKKLVSIRTSIDRQQGTIDLIGERVDDIDDDIANHFIHFRVDANDADVKITNDTTNPPENYVSIDGSGMRIYVDSEMVAEATINRFECHNGLGVQDWAIQQGENANHELVLNFFRKPTV